jgi:hypothetical protein
MVSMNHILISLSYNLHIRQLVAMMNKSDRINKLMAHTTT